MRISDCSSDVCSSDLLPTHPVLRGRLNIHLEGLAAAVTFKRGPDHGNAHERNSCFCRNGIRSEEHTSELQSLMRISYAVFCLKKKKHKSNKTRNCNEITPIIVYLTTTIKPSTPPNTTNNTNITTIHT